MAVVIETTLGDITVDLYLDQRPVTCLNFLKLCKMKYYNFNLFHTIRNGFIAQTGDPTGEGSGGQSIWGILEGPEKRFFSGEKMPKIRHTDAGLLSMVCTDDMMVGSQFFLTLAPDLDSLDGTHCVIGEVTEGREVLTKINEVICDENHRPYRDVRITHTVVLEDPFSDPVGLRAPSRSPSPNPERLKGGRIAPDEEIDEMQGRSVEEIQEMIEEKEAKARATILEIVGDLPDAEIAPPENVLFVCKLNPVTTDEDLEIIFSRFGTIVSCEVIKDKKMGNSLQYAFIEFDNKKSCEDAYFKMDNVLIDDRRIHVDFSQSVSKMRWLGKGRGVQYFDNDSKQVEEKQDNKDKRRYRNESRKNNHNRRDERDNKQEPDGDIEQRRNRDKEQKHEKDREHRHDRDREHKHDRDREHRYVRERYPNHDRGHRAKEQRHNREEEQNRDREQRQYRDKEKRYERDRGNVKERSRSRSRLNESQKNRQESDTERGNVRKNGNTYNAYKSRSDKLKHSPIRNNKHDFTTSRSQNEESECKDRAEKYENNHKNKYSHKKQKDDLIRYSKHTEQHNYYKHKESQKQTKRSGQQNDEPLTPSPTLKRKNNKLSIKKIETKSSKKVNKSNNRNKKSRTTTSTSDSSSSTSSSDSSSSSESDRRKKKLRRRRKYSTSSSSTESSSSSSSYSSSSSSSSDSEHKKKKLKNKKKNCKNK